MLCGKFAGHRDLSAGPRLWDDNRPAGSRSVDRLRVLNANVSSLSQLTGSEQAAEIIRPPDHWSRKPLIGVVLVLVGISVVSATAMIGSELLAVSDWINPSHIETAVGQQRTITLEDGSTVQVNTHTAVTVHFTPRKREVLLADGEARFTVAKNAERPFIVTTPQACVRAVGTVFNVQVGAHRTSVAVLEGHVRIFGRADEMRVTESPVLSSQPRSRFLKPAEDLFAGQRAAVSRTGTILRDAGPSIERVSAWTRRQLVFRDEPLSELVAEFNRYHDKALRIEDPGLAGFRVSGTFDAYDIRSLMQYLENYQGVHSHLAPDGTKVLTR